MISQNAKFVNKTIISPSFCFCYSCPSKKSLWWCVFWERREWNL